MAGCVVAVTGLAPHGPASPARADEVTVSQDDLRTGWDPSEPGLSPATVAGPDFGQIFKTHLNGQIYSQPIVAGNTVIVTTETNHVYGLNSLSGQVEWSDYLGPAEPATATDCGDVWPDIGITSTSVYDPATGTFYLVAVVDNGPTEAQPHIYAYAMDAQTGKVRPGWPVTIHGSPVNDPAITFNPFTERQRAGLLLLGGWIYVAFASYCDFQPYAGYVAGISTTSRALTLWTDEAGLTDSQGGIWQSNSGLMSDGPGRIFLATGNGVSPAPGQGTRPPGQLGDSVVRLSVARNGTLSAADFFSPANAPALDVGDQDLGSGGPVGLPFGTPEYPNLLVQAGKDGRLFVLNRDSLGGREQGPSGTDAVLSEGQYAGEWGHPAAFGPDASVSGATSGDYVYYSGMNDSLRYLQFGVSAAGRPVLTDVASTSDTFGFSAGSPVVTSDGSSGAVLWNVNSPNENGTGGGTLQAFDAVPPATCTASSPCTMTPIWSAPIGTASQFTVVATDGGRVYVGTRDGNVYCFGSPDSAPLGGAAVNAGEVRVGQSRTVTATMTASVATTVTSVAVTSPRGHPFRLGPVAVGGEATSLPVSLSAGSTLAVPVTFTPSGAGGVTGALEVGTTTPNFTTVGLSLTGQGTAPGLQSSMVSVNFAQTTDLTTVTKNVVITNDNTNSERVVATTPPDSPFRAWLPVDGRVLAPGQFVAVPVRFRPVRPGRAASLFRITTNGGHILTVRMTGTSRAAVSRLMVARSVVRFGAVVVGSRASATIALTNAGTLPATVTGTSGPAEPFAVQEVAPGGLPVNPGYSLTIPVTFTPPSTGPVSGRYVLRWRDAHGPHVLTVRLEGHGVAPRAGYRAVPAPGGGWQFNGSAGMRGDQLVLTGATHHQAGSAVYPVPEPGSDVTARFTVRLGGDGGMTFALLPAGHVSTRALGRSGGQFGFGGLPGVAVTLSSGHFPGDPKGDFAGIGTSTAGGGIRYAGTSRVAGLGHGSHVVTVTARGNRVSLSIGRRSVLSVQLPAGAVPASALIAFTGATGTARGSQVLGGVTVRSAAGSVPAPGGGWWFNGSAAVAGSAAELTTAAPNQAGTVVYPVPVPVSGLKVSFTAEIGGGSGGNGLSFALLNPASSHPTSLGYDGVGMGFVGLGAFALALDTVAMNFETNSNIAGLFTSAPGRHGLGVVQLAEAIPPLRGGPVSFSIQVSRHGAGYVITVWLDGTQILQHDATGLGKTAVLAFTGATGTQTDIHLVRDVAITSG
jgi:PQQ-like domain/Abnormal spindle-like microcephaly-assoc'd, ASPM-SPD-2-Hydin/Bacterial lectin